MPYERPAWQLPQCGAFFNINIEMITKTFSIMACLATGMVLQACSVTPISDEGLEALTDGNVVRAKVNWNEKAEVAFAPASYNVEAKYHHWVKENVEYRWIFVKADLRRDRWGSVMRTARIADGVPILKVGDWVDVYMPAYRSIDYSTLNAPVILHLVCANEDSACKDKSEKELGGKNEVVQKGMPDMSKYTFTKKFDTDGKLLK